MKIKIISALVLFALAITAKSQTYSDIKFASGTIVEIQTGASICADDIYINGTWTGGGTICGGPLPVTISEFNYSLNKRSVILSWVTQAEVNNSGFDIERRGINGAAGNWIKIGFAAGNGTTNEPKQYTFNDENLKTGKYEYRLRQVDFNGSYEYFSLMQEVIIFPPKNFEMGQNYPNPGNPKSKINFEIPLDSYVSVKVYDMLGRDVAILVDEFRKADYYTVEFNGSNLASGVYFYRINAENPEAKFTKTLKMIVVK